MFRRSNKTALSMVIIISLFGLVGCAAILGVFADALVPVEEENKLGEEFSQELEEELEFSDDQVLVEYVEDLGREIADVAHDMGDVPDGIEMEFHLVDDDEMINAFAIPGGGIYVFTGLLKSMDDEAELTAVLGHEVAHVTERHIAQRLTAAYGAELVSAMALGEEPGLVAQLVAAVAQQGALMSYSRSQEREADDSGLRYQIGAGYDPMGFISFFETLAGQPAPPTFLSTHPHPEERIDRIREQIEDMSRVPTRREQQRFEQMRDRIDADTDTIQQDDQEDEDDDEAPQRRRRR